MRSTFQYANHPVQGNISQNQQGLNTATLHQMSRSPQNRSMNFNIQHNTPNAVNTSHSYTQRILSTSQHQSNNAESGQKITGSIKNQQDKIQSVQTLMKQNKINGQRPSQQKKEFRRPQYNQLGSTNLKRDQSEPDLRTTCPNIFKKFDSTSNLRSTTHSNNYNKFGAIIAEIKKQEQQQQHKVGSMKKNSNNKHYQPLTPQPKIPDKQHVRAVPNTPLTNFEKDKTNFKSLNDIWNNKLHSNIITSKKNTSLTGSGLNKLNLSMLNNRKIINGFQMSKQLGKGKFGEVCLARHVQTNCIVAVKKIIKAKIVEYKMVEQFKRQIQLHSSLNHPNIVKFYGFFQDTDNVYLLIEYVHGGTLFDYLGEKDQLTCSEAAQYLRDTIQAISYMHDRSIAHRDIKPENIVLTGQKVAKLCDFGWSALVQSSRTTYCGTFDYAPPQILQRKNYDTAVDIWCIGVLTYEMLTGRVPFEGEKRKEIMQKIISVDKNKIIYPIQIPAQAKNFIQMLVQKDPSSRPKCKQLLKHQFFTKNLKTTSAMKDKK